MLNSCPVCGGSIELYDIAEDKQSGRYKCLNCGRNTNWKKGKSEFIHDIINQIKIKSDNINFAASKKGEYYEKKI
jgi:DNA-directed RNA polymerase subunit RPC12/RpoP